MKFIALDIGKRRIGVASCDQLEIAASPHSFVPGGRDAITAIASIIESEGAEGVVVGLPLSMDGGERDACVRVRAFVDELKLRIAVPVYLVDERYTTKIAEASLIEAGKRRENRRDLRDAVAAALILKSFLDRRHFEAEKTSIHPLPDVTY
ncbi:MAG: Holliday junction resolvase RuvX [Candidatus Riflebacteria bacterium]|nr:Holliday junction resolvase RuvX [Candidatus Riflebacteria bacterium]